MSVASGRNISFKPFFIAKAAQGILCALFMGIAIKLVLKDSIYESASDFPYMDAAATSFLLPTVTLSALLFTSLALLLAISRSGRKTLSKRSKKLKKGIDKGNFV